MRSCHTKLSVTYKGPKPNVLIRDKISFVGVAHLMRRGAAADLMRNADELERDLFTDSETNLNVYLKPFFKLV